MKSFQELVLTKIKPANRKSTLLSIDIGSKTIELVVSEKNSDEVKILHYEIIPLLEKAGFPEEQISKTIKRISKIYPKSIQNTYLNISGEGTFINKIILPVVEDKEIQNTIKWQIRKQVSFPTEKAILKYKIIPQEQKEEPHKRTEVLAAAISKELIDSIVNIVGKTGIYIKSIFVSCFSLGHIIKKMQGKNNEDIGVLDIGYKNSTISIYDKEGLKFLREIPVSSYSFTNAMTGIFSYQNAKIELDFKKAEKIKQTAGIPEEGSKDKVDDVPLSQIRVMLRPELERLSTELSRSFDYFKTQYPKTTLRKLYICGGGARLKNLMRALNNTLPYDVEKLPIPKSIHLKEKKQSDYLQLAAAIGSSLGANKLNLLPNKFKRERLKRISMASLRIVAVIFFISLLFSSFILNFKIKNYTKNLKYFDRANEDVKEAGFMYQYAVDVKNIANDITRNDIPAYLLLKGLSSTIPDKVAIESLELDTKEGILRLEGIIISEEAKFEAGLIDFKSKLKKMPFFDEVGLKKVQRLESKINKANFEITCELEKL